MSGNQALVNQAQYGHAPFVEEALCSELPFDVVRQLRRFGLYGLGEAYMDGQFEARKLDDLLYRVIGRTDLVPGKWNPLVLMAFLGDMLRNPQKGRGAFEVARRHYDLGNELFEAMLDKSMSYTCGYWRNARTLEEAQDQKLERLCQKLHLKPGMRVLDIGCGWGNFCEYAAKVYGVSVVGVTVSREQAAFARARCAGLPVEIELQDFRSISGHYDRVVSVEMIEAVGRKNLDTYFSVIERSLTEHGLCVLQVISGETFSRRSHPMLDQFVVWLLRHIFPNGYLPKLDELVQPGRKQFVLEDIENFSADYDKTLQAWRENFEHSWPRLAGQYGERFRRMWLFYLCGCMALFRHRIVQVYHLVYSKGGVPGGYRNEW